ncbi:hypothetical protein HDU83_005232 [Entophlyctis luteolus]|nr:hypothetical protein HDU82_003724 [Entophlyctis luteolus]KAJ3344452.1 hypothetical protein HDU83_005232 [Entophlyctis luteolus]
MDLVDGAPPEYAPPDYAATAVPQELYFSAPTRRADTIVTVVSSLDEDVLSPVFVIARQTTELTSSFAVQPAVADGHGEFYYRFTFWRNRSTGGIGFGIEGGRGAATPWKNGMLPNTAELSCGPEREAYLTFANPFRPQVGTRFAWETNVPGAAADEHEDLRMFRLRRRKKTLSLISDPRASRADEILAEFQVSQGGGKLFGTKCWDSLEEAAFIVATVYASSISAHLAIEVKYKFNLPVVYGTRRH